MAQPADSYEDKKEALKEMVRRLHRGEDPERVKEDFRHFVAGANPTEISQIEEELIREGMPASEIHRLCDVHLAVFKEAIEGEESALAPEGHPINTLMKEHAILLEQAEKLRRFAKDAQSASDFEGADKIIDGIDEVVAKLKDSDNHYLREENVLFPYLEKHGITQPPAVMWMEHDRIREIKKGLYALVDERNVLSYEDFIAKLERVGTELEEMLENHFYKENNVLFPTAMDVIEAGEWPEIIEEFDEIGYCCFTPRPMVERPAERGVVPVPELEGVINFERGVLTLEQIDAIFNTLPVEMTFVDADDTVRFFTETPEKIFIRTKASLGRKVQQCHPQKSVHLVDRILDEFRSGMRDVAEFWLTLKERFLHVRYFAVRSPEGKYLGCLEIVQDITEIKKLEGKKMLL